MAKLYKVEMYILDANEEYKDFQDIRTNIENNTYDVDINTFNVKEANFEWDDNLKINHLDATVEDYREYFEEV